MVEPLFISPQLYPRSILSTSDSINLVIGIAGILATLFSAFVAWRAVNWRGRIPRGEMDRDVELELGHVEPVAED